MSTPMAADPRRMTVAMRISRRMARAVIGQKPAECESRLTPGRLHEPEKAERTGVEVKGTRTGVGTPVRALLLMLVSLAEREPKGKWEMDCVTLRAYGPIRGAP